MKTEEAFRQVKYRIYTMLLEKRSKFILLFERMITAMEEIDKKHTSIEAKAQEFEARFEAFF